MIRFFIFLLLINFPLLSFSENVSLSFDSIKLNELAKASYVEIFNYDYLADSDFLKNDTPVTIYFRDRSLSSVESQINALIESNGFNVDKKGNLVRITKKQSQLEKSNTFFYKFKNRGFSYLMPLLQSSFPPGSFNFQRKIKSSSDDPQQQQSSTDTSALSQIDNNSLDSFIFNGSQNDIERLQSLLIQIDQPDSQVEIKAYLYEVKYQKTDQSGFNLALGLLSGKMALDFGSKILSNSISLAFNDLSAAITLFNSDSRFSLISSPHLRVTNNKKATFSVGSDVPVLGQVTQNATGQALQSVQYKPSGVILDVVPRIFDDAIELTIRHEISNFINTTTGINNTPTLIKRELNTSVRSKLQDVLVLGGLNEKTSNDSKSGFKLLPAFLKNSNYDGSESEILLILSVKKI